LAAGAKCHQQVARLPQRTYLARKDILIAVIVGDRGDDREVGRERDDGVWGALAFETSYQFGGQMLRLRRAPPIARHQHLMPASQRLNQFHSDLRQYRGAGRQRLKRHTELGAALSQGIDDKVVIVDTRRHSISGRHKESRLSVTVCSHRSLLRQIDVSPDYW